MALDKGTGGRREDGTTSTTDETVSSSPLKNQSHNNNHGNNVQNKSQVIDLTNDSSPEIVTVSVSKGNGKKRSSTDNFKTPRRSLRKRRSEPSDSESSDSDEDSELDSFFQEGNLEMDYCDEHDQLFEWDEFCYLCRMEEDEDDGEESENDEASCSTDSYDSSSCEDEEESDEESSDEDEVQPFFLNAAVGPCDILPVQKKDSSIQTSCSFDNIVTIASSPLTGSPNDSDSEIELVSRSRKRPRSASLDVNTLTSTKARRKNTSSSYQWSQDTGPANLRHCRILRGDYCLQITQLLSKWDKSSPTCFSSDDGIIAFFFGMHKSPYCEILSDREILVSVPAISLDANQESKTFHVTVLVNGIEMRRLVDFQYEILWKVNPQQQEEDASDQIGMPSLVTTPTVITPTSATSLTDNCSLNSRNNGINTNSHVSTGEQRRHRVLFKRDFVIEKKHLLKLVGSTEQKLLNAGRDLRSLLSQEQWEHLEGMMHHERVPTTRLRNPHYMTDDSQTSSMTVRQRFGLVNWMLQASKQGTIFSGDTIHLAVNLMDRYFSSVSQIHDMSSACKACLLIASKFHDVQSTTPAHLEPHKKDLRKRIMDYEIKILRKLEYNVRSTTTHHFTNFFSGLLHDQSVMPLVTFLANCSLLAAELLPYSPSEMARAIALGVASFSRKNEDVLLAAVGGCKVAGDEQLDRVLECLSLLLSRVYMMRVGDHEGLVHNRARPYQSGLYKSLFMRSVPSQFERELMNLVYRLEDGRYALAMVK